MSASWRAASARLSPSLWKRSKKRASRGMNVNVIAGPPSAESDHVQRDPSESGDQGGRRNGDDPCGDDVARDSPADTARSLRRPYPDDRTRDDVRRRNGHPEVSRGKDDRSCGRLGRETMNGLELGDAVTHGVHDPPAA